MENKNYKSRFRKWIKKIGIKFTISIVFSVSIGLLLRYLLKEYLCIDVIKDIFEPISIMYYTFMALYSSFLHEVVAPAIMDVFMPNLMMPSDHNFPTPSGRGSPTRLPTDNLGLPAWERNPAWNRPKPEDIPSGPTGKNFTATYGRGEPMDIALPDVKDRQYIYQVFKATYDYRTTRPFLQIDPQFVTALDVLRTLQRDGAGASGHFEDDRTFAIAKQLRKIIYNEPRFHKWINPHSNRISWATIKVSPGSELMVYLNRDWDIRVR